MSIQLDISKSKAYKTVLYFSDTKTEGEDPYASMYWPGQSETSDGYEPIDESKFGPRRSVRESMLKEIRKEMAKLLRIGVPKEKDEGKNINVRPGLALGVITLQAGARGPKLLLQ